MLQRGRGFRPFGIAPCGSLKCRCANRCEKGRFPSCDEAQNSYAESATSPRHCNPARRYRKAGPVYQWTALRSAGSRSASTVGLSPRQPGSSDPL